MSGVSVCVYVMYVHVRVLLIATVFLLLAQDDDILRSRFGAIYYLGTGRAAF